MKYIPEFLQDAMEDGALKTLREMIIKTLDLRFQTIPEELGEDLARIEDSTLLEELHSQAVLAGSLEDFMHFVETEMRVPH